MVTDDGQQVVGGDLGGAVLSQEGPQVQPLQGERHVAADLEGIHDLVAEALQVDAQDLQGQETVAGWRSTSLSTIDELTTPPSPLVGSALCNTSLRSAT